MTTKQTVLMICGSLRAGSTNEALLRTAAAVAPAGLVAERYQGMAGLPHFNPDDDRDPLPPEVVDLRGRIEAAGALLICTPEYAGALPGTFKNLLDWTVGGVEIVDKPTAWVNASSRPGPDGAARAHDELRAVLGYTGADVVEAACTRIPVLPQAVGDDGLVGDPDIRKQVAEVLATLAGYLERQASG